MVVKRARCIKQKPHMSLNNIEYFDGDGYRKRGHIQRSASNGWGRFDFKSKYAPDRARNLIQPRIYFVRMQSCTDHGDARMF